MFNNNNTEKSFYKNDIANSSDNKIRVEPQISWIDKIFKKDPTVSLNQNGNSAYLSQESRAKSPDLGPFI